MKASILPIAKSAMKYFFDIDPVITETVMMQAVAQGHLLHHELRNAIHANVQQRKSRIIEMMNQEGSHSWNAA
jgi:hypothetical protein